VKQIALTLRAKSSSSFKVRKMTVKVIGIDVLVIESGAAGLRAAIYSDICVNTITFADESPYTYYFQNK